MPSFYREQKTAKVALWKNISEDHGKHLNLSIYGETPFFKEEIQYLNNMGFAVSTMNSTGVRIEHNSINSTEIPKGFLIIFKYKVSAQATDRFRNFVFNIPKETNNLILKELSNDFNKFYSKQRNRISSFQSDYNFDFVMVVDSNELSSVDTVYIPECNITLTSNSVLKMPNNPTLAMRHNQKPVRVYACEEYKENFKYAITVQSVAGDHLPENYFYFLGKSVKQTESVYRPGSETGIAIITHEFNDENRRFNLIEKFIPIDEAIENGFFRTKSDLLTNGDPEEITKKELTESRIALEKLKHKTETLKANTEINKVGIKSMELKTELVKADNEYNKHDFEKHRHRDRVQLHVLETQAAREKTFGEIARETLTTVNNAAVAKMKNDQVIFQNNIDTDKTLRKHAYEIMSMELSLEHMQEKARIEQQTNYRKSTEEGFKVATLAFNLIKGLV